MTIPTKDRDKCVGTEKSVEELFSAISVEGITRKKVSKLVFGFLIFFSLFNTVVSTIQVCANVIDWTSPQTRSIIAAVFLVMVVSLFLLYCYCRDACIALWKPFVDEAFAIFSPHSSWNEVGARLIVVLMITYQFWILSVVFQWSWITLLFGPDASSNFYKSNDKIEGLQAQAFWNQTQKVTSDFRFECFYRGQFLIIVLGTYIINICCMIIEMKAASEHRKPSKLALVWRKGYGENEFGILYMSTYFSIYFTDNVVALLVLSGWVNAEFLQSLSWLSSFFLVAVPIYLTYFTLSCATELLIYAMKCCKREEKEHLALPEMPIGREIVDAYIRQNVPSNSSRNEFTC